MTSKAVLVSRRDAAEILGVSVDTVGRLIAREELPTVRIGKSNLIPAEAIGELIARGQARAR